MNLSRLPDDVSALKEIIHSQRASYTELRSDHSTLERNFTALRGKYDFLEEQLRLLKSAIYARKSEKYSGEGDLQTYLFNEAEETLQTFPESEKTEEITVAAHKRVKGGRRPLPEALVRVEVIHDLGEEEKACRCGARLSRIGEEVSEKLDIIPARMQVIKNIRFFLTSSG